MPPFPGFWDNFKFFAAWFLSLLVVAPFGVWLADTVGFSRLVVVPLWFIAMGPCLYWVEKRVSLLDVLKRLLAWAEERVNPGAVFWRGLSKEEKAGRYLDFTTFREGEEWRSCSSSRESW